MKTITTKLASFINRALRKSGFQIVRSPTIDRLTLRDRQYVELAQQVEAAIQNSNSTSLALESRVSDLEHRLSESTIENLIRYAMKSHWRAIDLVEQLSGKDKPETCPLCGHNGNKVPFKEITSNCRFMGGRLLRHICPNCDVIFGPQKMLALDEEMLNLEYKNLYRIYSEGDSTESTIKTFHLLQPRRNGVYLDFGCGGEWSEAISRLRQDGWNIYGFEPSASHSSEFVFSSWEEIEHKQFDGIFSHNLLEHLFDPVAITRKLSHLLGPDGRIVHATPCFEYKYDYSHFHVYFFTGRSPDILAQLAGMKIENWVREGDYVACILKSDIEASNH